ncbi:MAG TPA: Gfo/Idh/MocA family oxidoreductase, partial [Campylobacteraceae bacterium]|nr:Gfo/Idh/MocA family oxidoreductase [Campylobacteraceae bacterium]
MQPLRWGMIGCGAVTEVKSAPAYRMTEGFMLEGVMCRDLQKAKAYAAQHAIPLVFDDAHSLITDPRIDAVYIATPPDSHAAYALMAAEAGKICSVEKPITPDYASAREVVEAFETRELPLFVSYYRRSLPRFLEVKQWLDEGRIGTLRQVRWSLTRRPHPRDPESDHWRVDRRVARAGYFDDVGSHGIDLLIFLLGDIVRAEGFATNQQRRYSAADAITGCWEHVSGILGSGSWNFGCDRREDLV